MKYHRVLLDIDVCSRDEVELEARRLCEEFDLGGYIIEPSTTTECWRIIFPTSMFKWEDAVRVAESCRLVDRHWLNFSKRYECFGASTMLSRSFQSSVVENSVVKNSPVKGITLPVRLIIKPLNGLEAKRVIKLCESIRDALWQWHVVYPLSGVYDGTPCIIEVGCKDKYQAERRIDFLKKLEIDANFEIKGGT